MRLVRRFLATLWAHPISVFGTVLTTVTALTILFALMVQWSAPAQNVYATGAMLILLPLLFVLGLVLVAVGAWLGHRRRQRAGEGAHPVAAFGSLFQTPAGRRRLALIALLTLGNILLLGAAGSQAMHWMDSPEFCGTACHVVMEPEYASYRASPHARVACVQCHIGPGASFAVRSKIDGLRQVWRTLTDTYERPIPVPVHTLRPSRDTCEQCHWPDKFHGSPVVSRYHVGSDEDNTLLVDLIALRVGGRNEATGRYEGIHWHVSRNVEVRYEALDERRETIGKITVLQDGSVVREYAPPQSFRPVETRTMDCIDCHNRPTHVFDGGPAQALDRAFGAGTLDARVRWLRALAEPILARADRPIRGLEAAFRAELEAAYQAQHPEAVPAPDALDAAAQELAELWRANVFPDRKVAWGTYPNHIGHATEAPERHGCFRCHGQPHETGDGRRVGQGCTLCHEMLAREESPGDLDEPLRLLLSPP